MRTNSLVRLVLFTWVALILTACAQAGSPSLAYNTGLRVWIDQPPNDAAMPLGPFTLKAHARDSTGGGVERVTFLVNTIPLGTVNTDPTQSLVSAESAWNPSVEGEYRIQAQAFGRSGSAMSDTVVVCVGSNCTTGDTATTTTPAAPTAACKGKPTIDSFTVAPTTIAPGGSVTLNWTVSNADLVELSSIGQVNTTGTTTIAVKEATTVTLLAMCGGKENLADKQVSIAVKSDATTQTGCSGKPVIAAFNASPSRVTAGGSTTLQWSVTNASEVSIAGIGAVPASGSRVISPRSTMSYTLLALCNTKENLVERSISVTVAAASVTPTRTPTTAPPPPPPAPQGCSGTPNIASFSASPATISPGQSSTLSWGAVTNADSVEIDHGVGGVGTPGSRSVSPSGTTVFTLTARCKGTPATRQVQVTVQGAPPPPQDNTPPSIGGYTLSDKTAYYITGCGANTLTITTSASDTSGVASVQLTYRYKGNSTGSWKTVTMNPAGGSSYGVTVNVGSEAYSVLAGVTGTIEFYATARDVPGNSANGSISSATLMFCPG